MTLSMPEAACLLSHNHMTKSTLTSGLRYYYLDSATMANWKNVVSSEER